MKSRGRYQQALGWKHSTLCVFVCVWFRDTQCSVVYSVINSSLCLLSVYFFDRLALRLPPVWTLCMIMESYGSVSTLLPPWRMWAFWSQEEGERTGFAQMRFTWTYRFSLHGRGLHYWNGIVVSLGQTESALHYQCELTAIRSDSGVTELLIQMALLEVFLIVQVSQ